MFQNKLSEVLYEDGYNNVFGNNMFCDDSVKEVIDGLKEHEPSFIDEVNLSNLT